MKKKILFIMHMPPPVHGAAMMGKYIQNSQLINNTFNCEYINPTMASGINDLAKISIKKVFGFVILLNKIRRNIKRTQPDVCYFTPASGRKGFYKSFIIVWWLKLHRSKVLLHFHNKGISKRKEEYFEKKLFQSFFKNVKLIILSNHLYKEFEDYIDFKNVYICPNGIPATLNTNFKKVINTNKKFSLLFLSNMIEDKGVWLLLEACKKLKDNGYSFECNYIGKWSPITEDMFNSRVKTLGLLDEVKGHGAKYGADKQKFFEQADLFVFPTFYENETFGLVLLEAMEYQLPCISTHEGGIPSVVEEGVTGKLLKEKSSTDLANLIASFIDNPDWCTSMGIAGRKRFQKLFTLDVFEHNMKSILDESTK